MTEDFQLFKEKSLAEAPLNVLLIEDNHDDAELLTTLLGQLANPLFIFERCVTLEEGLKRLDDKGIDLIVLDLTLPDSRGYETFHRVSRKAPSVTLIVLTGVSDERLARRALQEGAQDFLVKGHMDFTQVAQAMRFAIERKRAETALRESEARVRSVLDNARDTIITFNEEGIILSFNPAGETTFGYPADEVIGKSVKLLMPDPYSKCREKSFPKFLKQRVPDFIGKLVEAQGLCKDGSVIPVEISLSKMVQEGQRNFIGVVRDITDRKKAEEKLCQAQNELVQAGKLAVLGEMTAEISHELNQPLDAIQTYIDNIDSLLKEKRFDEVQGNFNAIYDLTRRAGKIIKNVRNYSQMDLAVLNPVSLQSTLDSTLSLLSVGNRLNDVRIVRTCPEHDVTVLAESLKLEQVFINIISNALDSMEPVKDKNLLITLDASGRDATLTFQDSGQGFMDSVLPHVFEPFFTTKEPKQSLGLGLSISQNIIREFSGTLEARQGKMGGAEFIINLPITQPDNHTHL